jgi:parvulin-like peptidyl-prolyl isomerase
MTRSVPMARSLAALALSLASFAAWPDAPAPFAVVGDAVIGRDEYEAAVASGLRRKFYHGTPPAAELASYRREVGDRLIERALLLDEAKRRGLAPERARIDAIVAEYDRRYASSERWRANRDKMLPPVVAELERQSLVEQLERSVRSAPAPEEADARAYYAAHPELFTEPEQVRLSLIMLRVDPSSPRAVWDGARDEAARLHERLGRGADFGELARMHSADASAANDGDLGYVHRGMLPPSIEAGLIDALKPGEVSAPVKLLEGYAILRLEDRKPAKLREFAEVRARVAELVQRERADAAWKQLLVTLRGAGRVRVDESVYQSSVAQ